MNRFHNKYHRHNHHTIPFPGEPDSAHDPIASPDDPFRGDFHVDGTLSAIGGKFSDITVTNNFTVSGNTTFYGNLTVVAPVTHVLEHLSITPVLTTPNFYFKIDSNYNFFPLMEVYLNSSSIFVITSAGKVGIHTATPAVDLDVNGNTRVLDLTANNIHANNNVSISGGVTIDTGLTALSGGRLGYLDVGFVDGAHTYIRTISGNYDLQLKAGNNLNLVMHPDNTNRFPGKVGIKMEPKEDLTLNGQMSFRKNGFVLLDNSYYDTLRIITNREDALGNNIDDKQHLFSFTGAGKFIISDTPHDYVYSTCSRLFATHRSNIIDNTDSGELMSLTNITSATSASGPWIDLYRANGDFNTQTAVRNTENLGGIRAWGYNETTCFDNKSASIEFNAANDFTNQFQGANTSFYTVCAADTTHTPFERVHIRHDGNVGINTISSTARTPAYKFTVFDYPRSTNPAMVVTAGISASPMVQIIGGSGVFEQVGLRLTDLGVSTADVSAANINHIEFTHGSNIRPVARTSAISRGANATQGGSLFFSTTYDTATPIAPFERMRINHSGDVGIGTSTPNSRLHILDDNKLQNYGAGTARDVVTIATRNNTNGILLSSTDIQSRIYNRNTTTGTNRASALHITTSTSGAQINFGVSDEQFAVIMTSACNVGIGINETLDTVTAPLPPSLSGINTFRLGVSGNAVLFNSTATTDTSGSGAMLYFNRDLQSVNTDPIWIGRYNAVPVGDPGISELRINIGNEICAGNSPASTTYTVALVSGVGGFTGTYDRNDVFQMASLGKARAYNTSNDSFETQSGSHTITSGGAVFAGITGSPGTTDGPVLSAKFNTPLGIGINSSNTIYIADSGNHTIRRIRGTTVDTFAGTAGSAGSVDGLTSAARFSTPTGICVDSNGYIYVSDSGNHTIRRISPIGRVTTFAGTAGAAGSVDGKGAIARFSRPLGISIDAADNIYVADRNNATIRKITPTGVVTTIVGTPGSSGGASGTMPGVSIATPSHVAVNSTGTELRIAPEGAFNSSSIVTVTKTPKAVSYVNQDVLSIGNYPWNGTALSETWEKWLDVGACATKIYSNLDVNGDAKYSGDVTIDGGLTITNLTTPSGLLPLEVEGDLFVRGNIYATQDITAYWDDVAASHIWPSGVLSDSRVKLNPSNIANSLGKVMSLNGVYFTWDEEKQTKYKGRDVGVIAQEVEKILPEIVNENKDGYKEVQYHKIIPLLIECIKDLKKEIDELKSK